MELSARRPGPDVVRALALIGVVVMNYHGYLIQRGATSVGDWKYDLFEPWTGPLSTRFAATFVLVAGVGVTLMTKSARGDRLKTAELRLVLLSRGALLYVVGMVFNQMWPGSILPYYGVLFACAAGLFTLRSRTICAIGAAAVLAAWAIQWWAYETRLDGGDTTWLFNPPKWSPSDLVFGMFVNGTHPILPWLAFFCLGIVVGRQIGKPNWRVPVLAVGAGLFTTSALIDRLVSGARADTLFNNNPFDRGVVYVASALGTALRRVRRDRLAGRPLRRESTGRRTPTRRPDVIDPVSAPRVRVRVRGRPVRLGRTCRPRQDADVRRHLLGHCSRRRSGLESRLRTRPRRAGVSRPHVVAKGPLPRQAERTAST